MVPLVVTVPEVSPDAIVGPLTVSVPLSVSVSFVSTVKAVAPSSSVIVPVSATGDRRVVDLGHGHGERGGSGQEIIRTVGGPIVGDGVVDHRGPVEVRARRVGHRGPVSRHRTRGVTRRDRRTAHRQCTALNVGIVGQHSKGSRAVVLGDRPGISTATGASLTSVTVTVSVAVAVRKSFEPLVVPSSVMV